MSDRPPRFEGGACTDLAPGIAEKYFSINPQTQPLEKKTALAICGHCAVQAMCLEAALAKPDAELRGVIAGMPASKIRTLKQWNEFDLGITDEPPKRERPVAVTSEQPDAANAVTEYRRTATMTFEERVQGVFLDLRAGKYNQSGGISQAIGAIAFIRDQMAASEAASNRATV